MRHIRCLKSYCTKVCVFWLDASHRIIMLECSFQSVSNKILAARIINFVQIVSITSDRITLRVLIILLQFFYVHLTTTHFDSIRFSCYMYDKTRLWQLSFRVFDTTYFLLTFDFAFYLWTLEKKFFNMSCKHKVSYK